MAYETRQDVCDVSEEKPIAPITQDTIILLLALYRLGTRLYIAIIPGGDLC